MLRLDSDGVLKFFSANDMREPRVELGCPKAPDPKSATPLPTLNSSGGGEADPKGSGSLQDVAPDCTEDATNEITSPRPLPTDGMPQPHRHQWGGPL